MRMIVNHFWVHGTDGKLSLYEANYSAYVIREGVMCYRMVPRSERPCACSERECHERRLAAVLSQIRCRTPGPSALEEPRVTRGSDFEMSRLKRGERILSCREVGLSE